MVWHWEAFIWCFVNISFLKYVTIDRDISVMLAVGWSLSGKVATADLPEIGRSNLLPIYREKKKSKHLAMRQSI